MLKFDFVILKAMIVKHTRRHTEVSWINENSLALLANDKVGGSRNLRANASRKMDSKSETLLVRYE